MSWNIFLAWVESIVVHGIFPQICTHSLHNNQDVFAASRLGQWSHVVYSLDVKELHLKVAHQKHCNLVHWYSHAFEIETIFWWILFCLHTWLAIRNHFARVLHECRRLHSGLHMVWNTFLYDLGCIRWWDTSPQKSVDIDSIKVQVMSTLIHKSPFAFLGGTYHVTMEFTIFAYHGSNCVTWSSVSSRRKSFIGRLFA